MTTPTNQFNARSDQAALALKAGLKDRLGNPVQPRSVQVEADGQPARPLPPEGSYARQAIERARAEAEAAAALEQGGADPAAPIPPQAPPRQRQSPQPDGVQQHDQQPPVDDHDQSPRAQRRISELAQQLRTKEQELQQTLERHRQGEESLAAANAKLAAIEQQYQQLVSHNLESLDPETRAQVLADARITELMAGVERRLLQQFQPIMQTVNAQSVQAELARVAAKYPGFDLDVHGPLIEMFREKNPACSIEQAFRAVAEPEELIVGRQQQRATTAPPIVAPASSAATPRYVPQQITNPQPTAEEEVAELRQRAFQLANSEKPEDKRAKNSAFDDLIRARMFGGQRQR